MTLTSAPPTVSDYTSRRTADPVSAPLRELLVWVARCPRTYAEAMDAWQSHCPRFTVWEDALAAGLVEIVGGPGTAIGQATVQLTQQGRGALTPSD